MGTPEVVHTPVKADVETGAVLDTDDTTALALLAVALLVGMLTLFADVLAMLAEDAEDEEPATRTA